MIARNVHAWLAIAGILLLTSFAFADAPPTLRLDPFRSQPKEPAAGAARSKNGASKLFEPILRSTMVRERRSLVDLGGEILTIG